MLLNILRIPALNILNMFLNIIFSIGWAHTVVNFHSHIPTGNTNTFYGLAASPESMVIE